MTNNTTTTSMANVSTISQIDHAYTVPVSSNGNQTMVKSRFGNYASKFGYNTYNNNNGNVNHNNSGSGGNNGTMGYSGYENSMQASFNPAKNMKQLASENHTKLRSMRRLGSDRKLQSILTDDEQDDVVQDYTYF